MEKLIFFDIDGTLWDDQMKIEDSTREALIKLRENGHKTFLCSGRSRSTIQAQHLLSIGFDGIVASCGNYIEMDGKVLYDNLMDRATTDLVVNTLQECKLPAVLEGPRGCWIDEIGFDHDPYVDYLYELLGDKAQPIVGSKTQIQIEKASFDRFPHSDYQRCLQVLGDKFDFIVHESEEAFHVVEMVPKNTSKATGIEKVCQIYGISPKDVYAVGDSANDLDMLKYVGHSIGMGNSVDCVKEIVEYVTGDIGQGGIHQAMKYYGLI